MVRDTCDIKHTCKEYRVTVKIYNFIWITNTLSSILLMSNLLTLSSHISKSYSHRGVLTTRERVITTKLCGFAFNSSGPMSKIELQYIVSAIRQGKSIYSSHIQRVTTKILLFQWSNDCLFSLTP